VQILFASFCQLAIWSAVIKQNIIHYLITWVRQLRRIAVFKISTRMIVIFLMVLGAWVATKKLNIPPSYGLNDKAIHVIVFFGFSVLMDLVTERHPYWLWKGLPLAFYGLIIEVLQYFSPDRTFSLLDWVADVFGILLYFIVKSTVLWLGSRRRTSRL